MRKGRDRAVTLLTRHSLAPIMAALCQPTWVRLEAPNAPARLYLAFATKEWGPD